MERIYIDIDDVLADCSGGICKFVGRKNPYDNKENWGEREIHELVNMDWQDMWVKPSWEVWAGFELLPWANTIVKTAISLVGQSNVFLLTAPVVSEGCCYGKQVWANNNYPDLPLIIAKEKQACVDTNSFLIDDSVKNEERFINDLSVGNTIKNKKNNFLLFPSYSNRLANLVDSFKIDLNLVEHYIRANYEFCKLARTLNDR